MDPRVGGVNEPQISLVCRRKGITAASWMVLSQRCALQENILPEDIGLLDLSGNQVRVTRRVRASHMSRERLRRLAINVHQLFAALCDVDRSQMVAQVAHATDVKSPHFTSTRPTSIDTLFSSSRGTPDVQGERVFVRTNLWVHPCYVCIKILAVDGLAIFERLSMLSLAHNSILALGGQVSVKPFEGRISDTHLTEDCNRNISINCLKFRSPDDGLSGAGLRLPSPPQYLKDDTLWHPLLGTQSINQVLPHTLTHLDLSHNSLSDLQGAIFSSKDGLPCALRMAGLPGSSFLSWDGPQRGAPARAANVRRIPQPHHEPRSARLQRAVAMPERGLQSGQVHGRPPDAD
eukprot:1504426-Pyramimonas_sp.AAC.1